eukprot:3525086-Prymnesium_polylepis.1
MDGHLCACCWHTVTLGGPMASHLDIDDGSRRMPLRTCGGTTISRRVGAFTEDEVCRYRAVGGVNTHKQSLFERAA